MPLVVILNLLIALKLLLRSKQLPGGEVAPKIPHSRINMMLLGVTVAYIVLTLPLILGHIIAFMSDDVLDTSQNISLFIFGNIAQLLLRVNCSINFFLYVLLGKSFRDKFLAVLCCRNT